MSASALATNHFWKKYIAARFKGHPNRGSATAKVKEIDLTRQKRTQRGIYTLDGDDVKICLSPPSKGQPTEFTAEAGSGQALIVLEREKP